MIIVYLAIFLFLLPLLLLIGIVGKRIWYPNVKPMQPSLLNESILDETILNLDHTKYNNGDAAKFIGQWYACLQTDKVWETVKSFWDLKNFTFFRVGEEETAFSGDMMAGMSLAIAVREKEDKLTSEEKTFLGTFSWNMITSLLPFKIDFKDFSRGWIYTPFVVNNNVIIHALIILQWGMRYANSKTKRILAAIAYYSYLITHLPLLIFGMSDTNLFYKDYYFAFWFSSHSNSLTFSAGILNNIPFCKKMLKELYVRYGKINADIAALYLAFNAKETIIKEIEVKTLLQDAIKYRKEEYTDYDCKWYISIRSLIKQPFTFIKNKITKNTDYINIEYYKKASDTWLGGKRCHDRMWERDPLSYGNVGRNIGDLDIVFPLKLLDGCFDKFTKK